MKSFAVLGVLAAAGVSATAAGAWHLSRQQEVAAPLFSDAERKAIVAYWNAPGRYVVDEKPADLAPRVNVTVAGSTWWAKYFAALSKVMPAEATQWGKWAEAKRTENRALAENKPAIEAGVAPATLVAAIGYPPALYEKVQPKRYTVTFDLENRATAPFYYTDAIPFADRKAYYRFYRSANGVIRVGRQLSKYNETDKAGLTALFASVGKTELERRVLQGVSALEGGFEAVNTYDTGWVSIGFIQFITARNGDGSLASVLFNHKTRNPNDFEKTFRRFGIDVAPDKILVVTDPATGQEKRGSDAVQAVIDDKRLTAVFERAGATDGFRRAQVEIARAQYWPGEDPISVKLADGTVLDGLVSDVVKSEAGMATLMDRKVNRGTIGTFAAEVEKIMQAHGLKQWSEASRYELPLVVAMKYRADFLSDKTLTQPPAPPADAVRTKAVSPSDH